MQLFPWLFVQPLLDRSRDLPLRGRLLPALVVEAEAAEEVAQAERGEVGGKTPGNVEKDRVPKPLTINLLKKLDFFLQPSSYCSREHEW